MTQKIIFLNGPPRSGKDTIASYLQGKYNNVYLGKMANHLKRMAHTSVGLYNLLPDGLESVKDEPLSELPFNPITGKHYTPRELYIHIAERFLKPCFGEAYFGKMLLKEILCSAAHLTPNPLWVISDSGFREEAEPLIELFGKENSFIFHLYRPGTDFSKDSRSYWRHEGVMALRVDNDETLDSLFKLVDTLISYPIKGVTHENRRT